MAIWQYQLFLVPEEEMNSFFGGKESITLDDFDEIDWWKYRQIDVAQFEEVESILPRKKSWSDRKILFGDESSNCLSLFVENQRIVEISIRIDLREDFTTFLKYVCKLASESKCLLLNNDLKILYPGIEVVKSDIVDNNRFKAFLDKLK